MYTLDEVPTEGIQGNLGDGDVGIIGARSGYEVIQLFPAALKVLREYYRGGYPGMRIAAASSADTPRAVTIGRKAMSILEVFPGVSLRDVFAAGWPPGFEGNLQIGRTHPLSSDKVTECMPCVKRILLVMTSLMLKPPRRHRRTFLFYNKRPMCRTAI